MRHAQTLNAVIVASAVILIGGLGCVSSPRPGEFSEPYDFGFRGPGRLLLVFQNGEEELALVVSDADGARRQRVERPRDARWITPTTILVLSEEIPEEFRLPRTFMVQIQLGANPKPNLVIDGPRRHYDPEPSPDGDWLAIGVDVEGVGESDLEIWELGEVFERIASRAQALDEPRWSPDGLEARTTTLEGSGPIDRATVHRHPPDPESTDTEAG